MVASSLQQAITLIKSGDKQNGRRLLAEILKADPKNETAWLWMSSILDEEEQKRHCLEQVLKINPNNQLAQKGLAKLQPQPEPIEPARKPDQNPTIQPISPASPPPGDTPLNPKIIIKPLTKNPPRPITPLPSSESESLTESIEEKHIWFNPDHFSDKVVMIYRDTVVIANPKNIKQVQRQLDLSNPIMLGQERIVIPLDRIIMVSTNEHTKYLTIRYKKEKLPSLQSVHFASQTDRNEFFTVLQEKLQPKFERTTKEINPLLAMIMPIGAATVVIWFTYLLYGAALEARARGGITVMGRFQAIKLIIAKLIIVIGPTGVVILGAILIALVLVWTFKRMKKPPIMVVLTPVKDPPRQSRG